MKPMLKVKNQAESAEIYIDGTIIDDEDSSWVKFFNDDTTGYQFPKEIREQLDTVKGKPLTVYINSYGGSIPAGCAMANMIARHEASTTAIINGYCCSIATQIFFSANVCKMPTNAYLMIHKPFTRFLGNQLINADEMRAEADRLDVLQRGLESTYQKKALDGVTAEQITEMVNQETWLTGAECAKIFDVELLESVKTLNCVGNLDKLKALNYRKIPETLKFKDDGNKNPPSVLSEQQRQQKLYEDRKKQIEIALAKSLAITI